MIIKLTKQRVVLASAVCLAVLGFILAFLLYRHTAINKIKIPKMEQRSSLPNGEFLDWSAVKTLFPKYAKVAVIDVDTGLQFQVQRRDGYKHADVQPLTAADTAVMKQIYKSGWSWKRKAVIVQLDNGKKIAASMNGMPHGQGAIANNNFNGHFCIHFKGCKTHGGGKVDPAHQLMIWKSANILDQQFRLLSPQDIVKMFFTAVDQNELSIAGKLVYSDTDIGPFLKRLANIKNIKVDRIENIAADRFSVDIRLVFDNSVKEFRKKMLISTIQKEYWKVEASSILTLFDNDVGVESHHIIEEAEDLEEHMI